MGLADGPLTWGPFFLLNCPIVGHIIDSEAGAKRAPQYRKGHMMIETMDELAENGMATVLDSDDFGTLYQVDVPGATISVYDADCIYVNKDWTDQQPMTCAEMADYEWFPIDVFCEIQG